MKSKKVQKSVAPIFRVAWQQRDNRGENKVGKVTMEAIALASSAPLGFLSGAEKTSIRAVESRGQVNSILKPRPSLQNMVIDGFHS